MICTGHYYEDWDTEEPAIVSMTIFLIICTILQFILSIIIKVAKYKFKKTVQNQNLTLDKQNHVNYGNIAPEIMLYFALGFAQFLMMKLTTTPPKILRQYPNSNLIFFSILCYACFCILSSSSYILDKK